MPHATPSAAKRIRPRRVTFLLCRQGATSRTRDANAAGFDRESGRRTTVGGDASRTRAPRRRTAPRISPGPIVSRELVAGNHSEALVGGGSLSTCRRHLSSIDLVAFSSGCVREILVPTTSSSRVGDADLTPMVERSRARSSHRRKERARRWEVEEGGSAIQSDAEGRLELCGRPQFADSIFEIFRNPARPQNASNRADSRRLVARLADDLEGSTLR